ncbi:MATE family efflux transporter [Dorea acetigenes]|uniref:MATE family efflux transporter n=1 Tax=Dorea acetigenes TaxID=2981787 RepID=A0ABT2RSR2_9FIRM|nr:MATE family efflux transporter [Dorea acetigenes]MCU6688296.1 MATE family efflux transporter [Dorea acetigenes]SCJ71589.1 Na(+)/drug antiporter [uncultured Clostridium sp.]
MERDMTTGAPGKIILNFTIPIFIGNMFQQLYSMVDTIIVGKFVGNEALAAVGSCGTLMFLILGFLIGLTAGFMVITSQHYGSGNMRAMRQSVASAAILSAVISVLMTLCSMLMMKQILHLMNTPEDIYQEAYGYIMVICGGIAAQVLYNLLASILRALGDSKVPLYFLILAAFLNIVLDLVFIIVFHMGAAGAALATVISQGASGILCLVYIIKKVPELHLRKEDWKFGRSMAIWQMKIGIPMALQYSITAIGTIMVQSALNMLGSLSVAGFAAANKIEQLVTQAYVAIGTTMATYCAQNTGAGRIDRVRQGFRAATVIASIYAVVTGLMAIFGGKYLTVLFVSENLPQIMELVDIYMKCIGAVFIPLAVVNIYRNGIQGMGYGLLPMMAGVAELIGRGVVALIAASRKSYVGACLANPAAWLFAGALLLIMYFSIMKKREKNSLLS